MKKTVSFSKNAVNIFFHILTRCNLNCRHCYINPEQHGKETLPIETIEAWLASFVRKGKKANLIFLGGEPTLHPDLASAIKTARKLGYSSITVDTNGYLFNDILSNITPQDVDYFSFSLDGATSETNDRLRGKGCFRNCTAGIKKAVAAGFDTSLIYTVSNDNIDELGKMPVFLKDLGINRFFIQVIGIRGKMGKPNRKGAQVSRSKWLDIIPDVAQKAAHLGITVTYPKVYLERKESFECAGLVAENYFVFPNGRVYRCPLCEDYPIHSMDFIENRLGKRERINEADLFSLNIPEGCVMNKIIQPENLSYEKNGTPTYQIACCMLKEEIRPDRS